MGADWGAGRLRLLVILSRLFSPVNCSSQLYTEPSGYISSVEYPKPYGPDLRCNYSIRVERGLTLNLKFLEPFEIDDHQQVHCPYDQLQVWPLLAPSFGASHLCFLLPAGAPCLLVHIHGLGKVPQVEVGSGIFFPSCQLETINQAAVLSPPPLPCPQEKIPEVGR